LIFLDIFDIFGNYIFIIKGLISKNPLNGLLFSKIPAPLAIVLDERLNNLSKSSKIQNVI